MIHAELYRQLMINVNDTIGTLAEVTSTVSASGINLIAICAYSVGQKVAIMFVSEDNNEAKRLLEARNFVVREEEVILLSIENKPGALQAVTDEIAAAGVNLRLIYGSVDKEAKFSRIVLISEDNMEVMMIIKTLLERS